jgi:hypothetical protein
METKKPEATVVKLEKSNVAEFEEICIKDFGEVFKGIGKALLGKDAEFHIVQNGIGIFVNGGRIVKITRGKLLIFHDDTLPAVKGEAIKKAEKKTFFRASEIKVDWSKAISIGRVRASGYTKNVIEKASLALIALKK